MKTSTTLGLIAVAAEHESMTRKITAAIECSLGISFLWVSSADGSAEKGRARRRGRLFSAPASD